MGKFLTFRAKKVAGRKKTVMEVYVEAKHYPFYNNNKSIMSKKK